MHNVNDPDEESQVPHSTEAEQGVLGCTLLSPVECIGDLVSDLPSPDVFHDLRHRTLWELLVHMFENKEAIDIITVQQRLKDSGQLNAVGGIAYLASLPDKVPSAANLCFYVELLMEKYLARSMMQVCSEMAQRVQDGGDPVKLLDCLEKEAIHLRRGMAVECDWGIKTAVSEAIEQIEEACVRKERLTGLPTGFMDLDFITGGLQKGDMIVIAGRPSIGKSTFVLNIADHVSVTLQKPVGYFSFEMSATSLMRRAIHARARVSSNMVRDGLATDENVQKLSRASSSLYKASLFVDAIPSQTVAQVRSKAIRMRLNHNVELLIIDYLQLLSGIPGKKYRSRQEEVKDVSNTLKQLARELNIPVVVLSALNRSVVVNGKTRTPTMADLKESGDIEQDADLIGLLYRAKQDNRNAAAEEGEQEYYEAVPVNLRIDKQRDGRTGTIHFTFLRSITRFEQASKIANDDVPRDQATLPYNDV